MTKEEYDAMVAQLAEEIERMDGPHDDAALPCACGSPLMPGVRHAATTCVQLGDVAERIAVPDACRIGGN